MVELILPNDGEYSITDLANSILKTCKKDGKAHYSPKQAQMLARYLIEPREEKMIDFNL